MKLCVTHFYNEELLLPFWLEHHKDIFDHVVLIDHHSTDRSVEIIKEICPTWEIRQTRNAEFNAINTDFEVMSVESEYEADWKIALTTTEFLVVNDLARIEAFLLDSTDCQAVLPGSIMIDKERKPPEAGVSLIEQYPFGMWEDEICYECIPPNLNLMGAPYRSRVIHNALVGAYAPGRHKSFLPRKISVDRSEAYIAWFGFAPAAESYLQRKIQIKSRIPKADLAAGFGRQHKVDMAHINRQINYLAPRARRLQDEMSMLRRTGIQVMREFAKPMQLIQQKISKRL